MVPDVGDRHGMTDGFERDIPRVILFDLNRSDQIVEIGFI